MQSADGAAGHILQVLALQVYYAKTSGLQAGVNAKYSQNLSLEEVAKRYIYNSCCRNILKG
jgi:hypothetical protein